MRCCLLLGLLLLACKCVFNEEEEIFNSEDENTLNTVDASLNKAVFQPPKKQDDALLSMYFESPSDMKKMVFSKSVKAGVDSDISKYDGQWSVEVPLSSAAEGDYALVLKSEGKHHAISVDIGRDYQFDQEEFVLQYEVLFINALTCGGAYIKLLSAAPDLSLENLHDKTPYTIMFGPDKCGTDAKIHFIFRHKNPKTGQFEEKHMNAQKSNIDYLFTDKKTHLFTLVTRSDNSFEVYIDRSLVKSGNLLTDFTPAVNPPAKINDPDDKKPTTWDDREEISDPDAEEPKMPDGWLLDTPKYIPDPDAKKPEDWNSDKGEFEPPLIDNPACKSAPGCGPWESKWTPPMIPNPKYDGLWVPKKIDNPDYFEDKQPYRMTPIRALGLELWSMTSEIAFDNFYIGTSKKGADNFAADTWDLKHKAETSLSGKSVVDGIRDLTSEYPWIMIAVAATFCVSVAVIIYCCCCSSTPKDYAHHKKTDESVPDSKGDSDVHDTADEGENVNRSDSDSDKEEDEGKEESGKSEEDEANETATRQRTHEK